VETCPQISVSELNRGEESRHAKEGVQKAERHMWDECREHSSTKCYAAKMSEIGKIEDFLLAFAIWASVTTILGGTGISVCAFPLLSTDKNVCATHTI
jgi:hypothetical protein